MGCTSRVQLNLPWPPSVNQYWRHVSMKGGTRALVSEQGREYRKRALWEIKSQLKGGFEPFTGPVKFDAVFFPPDRRKRDLDNLLKATLDALTAGHVWVDDHLVHEISVRWGEVRKDDPFCGIGICRLAERVAI